MVRGGALLRQVEIAERMAWVSSAGISVEETMDKTEKVAVSGRFVNDKKPPVIQIGQSE
jgi:hypothetical protein